ncbi:MAG: fimbrillin family protein [Candidatus Cryptobacteroides sp.]
MKRILLPVTLVLLLAAGCAKEAPSDRDIPIQLSVSLEGSTKATHEEAGTIKDLDFIVRNKNNSKYSFSSTRFYPDGGRWVSDIQRLWQGNQIAVDMLALSPSVPSRELSISDENSSPLFSWEVESVQTSGSYASDLLYTWKSNSTPNISDVSAAGFSIGLIHAMSLLKINVTLATEFNAEGVPQYCPLAYLSIDGLKRKGDYYNYIDDNNTWKGIELRPVVGSEGSINSYMKSYTPSQSDKQSCSAVYECIVLPQQPTSFTVKAGTLIKEVSFTPRLAADFKFEAGKYYTLNLKVGKDKIEMVGGISASAWIPFGRGDLNLDDESTN